MTLAVPLLVPPGVTASTLKQTPSSSPAVASTTDTGHGVLSPMRQKTPSAVLTKSGFASELLLLARPYSLHRAVELSRWLTKARLTVFPRPAARSALTRGRSSYDPGLESSTWLTPVGGEVTVYSSASVDRTRSLSRNIILTLSRL